MWLKVVAAASSVKRAVALLLHSSSAAPPRATAARKATCAPRRNGERGRDLPERSVGWSIVEIELAQQRNHMDALIRPPTFRLKLVGKQCSGAGAAIHFP